MTTRTTTYDYEQSSESGRERHVEIPYARLVDATPTLHDPAAVTALVAGTELTGTVITLDAVNSIALLNVALGAVYRHNVRNVLTYGGGPAEATWGPINIGDPVFYDPTSDLLNGIKLSTSPLNGAGAANPRFGTVVMMQDETASSFPKGTDAAGSTHVCAVMQIKS